STSLQHHSCFFSSSTVHPLDLHSFPTRRSSDLQSSLGRVPLAQQLEPGALGAGAAAQHERGLDIALAGDLGAGDEREHPGRRVRSEEHTSELQSRENLVCRLLLEKKKKHYIRYICSETVYSKTSIQVPKNATSIPNYQNHGRPPFLRASSLQHYTHDK